VFDIPKTMRAVVYRGPDDLRVETLPVPRIGPDELLVKVAACGVCPTDIKKIQYGTVPPPRVFGHETAGVIVRVGARMRRFKIGDRVALHHHVPCLDCHFCRHRAFAQCAAYKRTGVTAGFEPAGGGFAEYVRVLPFVLPGVVKIPSRNSFEEGTMLEPVNTVLKAVRRLSLLRGDVVLVAGQGPVGLMFTRLLELHGANVIATDLLETRLKLAKQFGARWTFCVETPPLNQPSPGQRPPSPIRWERDGVRVASSGSRAQGAIKVQAPLSHPMGEGRGEGASTFNPQPSTLIHRLTHGRGLDAAIIAVPSDAVVCQAQAWLRGGGQLLLFAHTRRSAPSLNPQPSTLNFPLDLASICVDEKDLLGSYSADFTLQAEVARLVFSRRLDVRPLVTHRFPLEQTAEAVRLAARPTPDSLKVVVSQDAI
jgi:L-iditol 2-dehydrogenase